MGETRQKTVIISYHSHELLGLPDRRGVWKCGDCVDLSGERVNS